MGQAFRGRDGQRCDPHVIIQVDVALVFEREHGDGCVDRSLVEHIARVGNADDVLSSVDGHALDRHEQFLGCGPRGTDPQELGLFHFLPEPQGAEVTDRPAGLVHDVEADQAEVRLAGPCD